MENKNTNKNPYEDEAKDSNSTQFVYTALGTYDISKPIPSIIPENIMLSITININGDNNTVNLGSIVNRQPNFQKQLTNNEIKDLIAKIKEESTKDIYSPDRRKDITFYINKIKRELESQTLNHSTIIESFRFLYQMSTSIGGSMIATYILSIFR